jgi:hypothetical protein
MRALAFFLLPVVASTTLAATGTLRTERFTSIRQHDSLILALEDSCLCDTSMTTDSRGITYLAYCDSARVLVRATHSPFPSDGPDKGDGVTWSSPVLLDRNNPSASPVIFELADPGKEPILVVMWRCEAEGLTYVMRSYLYPGVFPPQWSPPLVMGSRSE